MPMSRATARRERFAPSVARWRRAVVLISSIISARTRARIEAAVMVQSLARVPDQCKRTRAALLTLAVLSREHGTRWRAVLSLASRGGVRWHCTWLWARV